MTIPDLAQIGSHNKREKKVYQSNKDIKIELSKNNIELVHFQLLKKFLRKLLQRGNDYTKDETAEVVKKYYNEDEYDKDDFDLNR